MSNPDKRAKVTVEDLLRFKRLERPAAEFWSDFERELRQKQLSALVEKRAWWHDLPQLFSRRVYLPIGATAILAFTLVSVKYYSYSPLQAVQTESEPVASVALRYATENAPVVSNFESAAVAQMNQSPQALPALEVRDASLAPNQTSDSLIAQEMPRSDFAAKDSPSARSIAANLAHLEQSEPELLNSVLGSRLSSPARLQASSAPVTELASLSSNGSKRNRLVAHYTDRPAETGPASSDAVRERITRRLADGDFNDHFSRIGVKGNRVSLKF